MVYHKKINEGIKIVHKHQITRKFDVTAKSDKINKQKKPHKTQPTNSHKNNTTHTPTPHKQTNKPNKKPKQNSWQLKTLSDKGILANSAQRTCSLSSLLLIVAIVYCWPAKLQIQQRLNELSFHPLKM